MGKQAVNRLQSLIIGLPGSEYSMPQHNGAPGQILTTDRDGNAVWSESNISRGSVAKRQRTYHGRCEFIHGDDRVSGIKFPPLGHTNYNVSLTISYEGDKEPQFFNITVLNKTDSSFEIRTDKPVFKSLNEKYWLEWSVIEDST